MCQIQGFLSAFDAKLRPVRVYQPDSVRHNLIVDPQVSLGCYNGYRQVGLWRAVIMWR